MFFWIFTTFVWATPSDSIIRLRSMSSNAEQNEEGRGFPLPRKINPLRQHAIAEVLLLRPSFLAMINRYVSGEDIARDIASQKKDIYVLGNKSSRWYWLKDREEIQFVMLALTKKEIYPERDPFSKTRNKTLFDSIRVLKDGCTQFTSEIDGTMRRWTGQKCPYGNVWIEWEATREFPMYVLIQRK
ncbi:MAG: hypothetical protein CL916_10915 [Deltaproteobacteria bacterium]|nr:hypothetical protein [Deltaproteobacteria bacterium]